MTSPEVFESALSSLLNIAAIGQSQDVNITNGNIVLKSRFAADEAVSAAISAGGMLAAEIWKLRSGENQTVFVNTREAAAALTGFLHQKFADKSEAPVMKGQADLAGTAANGFKQTKDGRHIYLHPSFPKSTKALLRVLDCEDTQEDVAATCLRWNALELEDAIAAAGACAAMARTADEWDSSEQGRILAARPVIEIVKIGDSAPEPFHSSGTAALSGIRVLDLTRVLAGPTCARTLAQFGADAMVISSPDLPSVPYFVSDTGHGKRAAFVDLKTEEGREQLRALVRSSDVFSQGYRQGSLERLGFGALDLAQLRPGIICTEINCYGHEGPWRGRPGWEQLAQTVTGMAIEHGGFDSPKLQPGAVCDYTTGFLAAFGTMIALYRRAVYGGSYLVRASLCQTATWIRALGIAPESRLDEAIALTPEEIASFSIRSDTGFGPLTHLRPPLQMSITQPHWSRGVVPLGTHEPVWD